MPISAQTQASMILSDANPISIYHRWAQFGKGQKGNMKFVMEVHALIGKELHDALSTPEFKAYYAELLAPYRK